MNKHKFAFPELRPEIGSNRQPYVRLLVFINKRKDISQEKFHVWWRSVHADLAVAIEGFGGHCTRYVQTHTTPTDKAALIKYGMEPLPFDGMGEMHVKSLDDWVAFQKSPAFARLGEDGGNFTEGPVQIMVGYDHLIYGSKSTESGGSDGILPGDKRIMNSAGKSKL